MKKPRKHTHQELVLHNLIEKDKETDLYAAICLELNVASQGATAEEAIASLREAVDLYLDTVYELGEEDQFVPRPADPELWIRYFELEAHKLKKEIRKNKSSVIRFENSVYA